MSEENFELEAQDTSIDYLSVINELKANSVSKLDYETLREENRRLLNNIVNNVPVQQEEPEVKMRSSEDIRDELFNTNKCLSNMEYIGLAVELRDSVLAETGDDIFTVHRPGEVPSEDALASAERTADVFKQCLENCSGDPNMFTALLQQRMQDVAKTGRR